MVVVVVLEEVVVEPSGLSDALDPPLSHAASVSASAAVSAAAMTGNRRTRTSKGEHPAWRTLRRGEWHRAASVAASMPT
jgi:hypothetical protein